MQHRIGDAVDGDAGVGAGRVQHLVGLAASGDAGVCASRVRHLVGDAASVCARLFHGAVYFFGAVPLAGVWVLADGEVRASRWRAAATHVRVAVVHLPGAASWDDGGADVCPACRVRFDAIRIVRLFFSSASCWLTGVFARSRSSARERKNQALVGSRKKVGFTRFSSL